MTCVAQRMQMAWPSWEHAVVRDQMEERGFMKWGKFESIVVQWEGTREKDVNPEAILLALLFIESCLSLVSASDLE